MSHGKRDLAFSEEAKNQMGEGFDMIAELEQAGLAKISIEQFKGNVINLIIDTVLQIIKIQLQFKYKLHL